MEHRETPGGARAPEAPDSAYDGDTLQGSRAAKRWTLIGVYLAILGYGPLYLFVLGYQPRQVLTSWMVGFIIATIAIQLAFAQVFKLRKRSTYPGVVLTELGRDQRVDAAARHAVAVVRRLLDVRAAFLALRSGDDGTSVASVSGMGWEVAELLLHTWMPEAREAMRSQQSVPIKPASGAPGEPGVSRDDRLVLIPVVALQQPIGILAVAGARGNRDLKDDHLLGSVGVALGLSLENLRQQEELRESGERLRSVIACTPIVMFALDREGTFMLAEGNGLDTLGFHPSHVLGRSVFDQCRDMPQVLESVRRALAGEAFTTTLGVDGRVLEAWLSPVWHHNDELSGITGVVTDITERKRADEALRESEEKLRSVIDNVPDMVTTITPDGTFIFVNRTVPGLSEEGIIGTSVYDYVPPEDHETLGKAFEGVVSTGKAGGYESRGIGPDGTTSWYSCRVGPIKHNDEVVALTLVATDVTERKRAEEALQESEAKFRTLTETVAAAAFIFQGTRIRYVNSAAEALTGYTRAEMLEMDFWDVTAPDFRELARERGLARQRGGDVPMRYEVKLLTKDGEERWVDFTAANTEFDGKPAVLGTAFDVTERKRAEEALQQSEELYRLVTDNVTDMIWTRDLSLRPTYTSPSVTRLRGYSVEEAMAQSLDEVLTPASLELARKILAEELALENTENRDLTRSRTLELEMYRKDGSTIWTEMTVTFMRDQDGRPVGLLGVTRDISERRRAEEALRESEAKFRTLTETVAAAAFIFRGARLRYVNSATEALTGYTRDELLAMNRWDVVHPDFREIVKERGLARERGEDVPRQYECKLVTKSGEERWVDFTMGAIEFEGKPAVLGTAFDVTERKRAEETIKHLAYHDALTDLPNRALFQDRLTVALAHARRSKRALAVMFLDLDRFKVVHDTIGHGGGDKLLRNVVERLTGLVREGDTVARVGGDEFAILSSELAHVKDAPDVAERVLDALRQPWVVQGQEFRVTTSIGIALYPGDGEDAETLLRNAGTAMYRAKEHGRDNFQLYTPTMNARIAERLAVESSLRHGLERGEFVVHYQPQVDLRDGQVVGTEALVRWQHPERGLVLPAEFIPVAEDTGLIVPLGEWVLRTACAQNKDWQEQGLPPLRVAVNLSARQFQQRNLIDMVAQVLEETGLAAHCLQLEITEGVTMQDVDFTIAVLRSLRAMGIQIAMDDFGTGYSSLSYLKRLPVNAVKIDRSFVRDLTIDPNDAAIATAVIAMAHNLGLSVIAEGVETEEQLALLKQWQCDEMQGYLFSRPAPAEAVEEMLGRDGRSSRGRRPMRAVRQAGGTGSLRG